MICFLSYLFIYSENILDVLKMFTYLFLVDLLKDLALMQKDFIPISVIRVKDITFCSGIVYLRNIVNINNPNVPVSVRRSL